MIPTIEKIRLALEEYFGLKTSLIKHSERRYELLLLSPSGKAISSLSLYKANDDEDWIHGGYGHIITDLSDDIRKIVENIQEV